MAREAHWDHWAHRPSWARQAPCARPARWAHRAFRGVYPMGPCDSPPDVATCEPGPGCSEFCRNLRNLDWLLRILRKSVKSGLAPPNLAEICEIWIGSSESGGFENQKLKKPNVFSMLRTSKIRNWRKSANLVPAAPDFAEICEQGPGCS